MKKFVRSLFVGAALAMPLVLVGTSPAVAANADVAAIEGSGFISPGLGATPTPQIFEFDGTATVVGTDGVLATYPCHFAGNDINGSAAEGAGFVAGNCGPLTFTTCVFIRIGVVVVVVCADASVSIGAGVCVFQPTNTLPTTDYTLNCAAAGAKAP